MFNVESRSYFSPFSVCRKGVLSERVLFVKTHGNHENHEMNG